MILLLLVLCLAGYALGRLRWRRCRWFLYGLALVLFLSAGCGPLPACLLDHLQAPYAKRPDIAWASRNAIVLLGAGTTRVVEGGSVEPTLFANGRMLEAYALYHACKQSGGDCKIVVSGGDAYRNGVSEAASYAKVLQRLGADGADIQLDARSMNTWQNAQFVRPLIDAYAPQRLVLVTSATHLDRALIFFAHFGMHPIPVRGDYVDIRPTWIPNSLNLVLTDLALHEYMGLATYHVYDAMGWNAPPSRNGAP
ncbi:MAG TPA: YdcF family protein [Dyella sp.]|uniref:YdcF family protein n=1 Tax=Dyella sp. TaxID=1869338 RepID=UPI002D170D6D|nr:YdcF family protein [Dyella sp.]HTV84091.1 YdcF family protein [Dyella sp.]